MLVPAHPPLESTSALLSVVISVAHPEAEVATVIAMMIAVVGILLAAMIIVVVAAAAAATIVASIAAGNPVAALAMTTTSDVEVEATEAADVTETIPTVAATLTDTKVAADVMTAMLLVVAVAVVVEIDAAIMIVLPETTPTLRPLVLLARTPLPVKRTLVVVTTLAMIVMPAGKQTDHWSSIAALAS